MMNDPIIFLISVDKLSFGYFRDKIEGNFLEWGMIRLLGKSGNWGANKGWGLIGITGILFSEEIDQ